jgi:hypothetical protein
MNNTSTAERYLPLITKKVYYILLGGKVGSLGYDLTTWLNHPLEQVEPVRGPCAAVCDLLAFSMARYYAILWSFHI